MVLEQIGLTSLKKVAKLDHKQNWWHTTSSYACSGEKSMLSKIRLWSFPPLQLHHIQTNNVSGIPKGVSLKSFAHFIGPHFSNAPLTLLRFCTKKENKYQFLWNCSHYSEQNCTKNGGFLKRSSKWICAKMEIFETLWISVNAQKWIKTNKVQQQQQNILLISRQIQR